MEMRKNVTTYCVGYRVAYIVVWKLRWRAKIIIELVITGIIVVVAINFDFVNKNFSHFIPVRKKSRTQNSKSEISRQPDLAS